MAKYCIGCNSKEMMTYSFVEDIPLSTMESRIIRIDNNNVKGHVLLLKNTKEFSVIYYCPWCGRELVK